MSGLYPDRIRALPLFDGQFDAYRLAADAADVLFASYPAGQHIPPHTHETDNHGVITRGELLLTIDGQQCRFGPGDWYHVPAGVLHEAYFPVATDEIELWFHTPQIES
ncbi:MAG: cupin domain-containing protein [Pseudomonadota bacterium]